MTVNYLLESGISLTLFALFYLLFLRKETFFMTNRLFLLISVIFSLLLPLLVIPVLAPEPFLLPEVTVTPYRNLLETVLVERENLSGSVERLVISSRLLVNVWLAGVVIMTLIMLLRVFQILRIIRRGQVTDEGSFRMVLTGKGTPPFSFLHYLFIPEEFNLIPGYERIVFHEREHIRQGHTWDILLLDILLIYQWFNPFIWLLKRAVRENHEYLVDRAVLRSGITPAEYKNLLLSGFAGPRVYAAHHFNYSLLKNRFKMMTKIPSRRSAGIKSSVGILVALALVLVFACEKKTSSKAGAGSVGTLMIETSDTLLKISGAADDIGELESLLASRNFTLVTTSDPGKNVSLLMLKKGKDNRDQRQQMGMETSEEGMPDDDVFVIVEVMPEYPGGESALRQFISQNISYPVPAQENGIEGKVYVSFVVSTDGSVRNAKVVRGVDPILDREALRVVNAMPAWKPGKQRGKEVNVAYTVPISFKLQ